MKIWRDILIARAIPILAGVLAGCSSDATTGPTDATTSNDTEMVVDCPVELPEFASPLGFQSDFDSLGGVITAVGDDEITFLSDDGETVVFRAPGGKLSDYFEVDERIVQTHNYRGIRDGNVDMSNYVITDDTFLEFGLAAGENLPEPPSVRTSDLLAEAVLGDELDAVSCRDSICDHVTSRLTTHSLDVSMFGEGVHTVEPGSVITEGDRDLIVHAADTVTVSGIDPGTCGASLPSRTRIAISVVWHREQ